MKNKLKNKKIRTCQMEFEMGKFEQKYSKKCK